MVEYHIAEKTTLILIYKFKYFYILASRMGRFQSLDLCHKYHCFIKIPTRILVSRSLLRGSHHNII